MSLKLNLIELVIVERTKVRRESAQCLDESKLRRNEILDQTKACLARELEPELRFLL